MLKYKEDDFVEFLRRVLDFPRRGVLNVNSPDFSDLSNEVIAAAYGATRRLEAETTTLKTRTMPVSRWKPAAGVTSNYKRPAGRREQVKTGPATPLSARFAPEATPLDGSRDTYVNGPFTNPTRKIDPSHCCYCWNASKPCKFLNPQGICRKLHICSHDGCRTLYHHGHRLADHQQKSA